MRKDQTLFDGLRPSDMRFDHAHVLAEFIARAQRYANSAERVEQRAEALLDAAMKCSTEGIAQSRSIQQKALRSSEQLEAKVEGAYSRLVEMMCVRIGDAFGDGAKQIRKASSDAELYHLKLASHVNGVSAAAKRLEQAAAVAEEGRKRLEVEAERLRQATQELARREANSLARLAGARRKVYEGMDWADRLGYVFFPPKLDMVLDDSSELASSRSKAPQK